MYKPKKLKKGNFATSLSTDEMKKQGATEKAHIIHMNKSVDWSGIESGLSAELTECLTVQKAGRDNVPYYEASGTGDLNNTAQQHVKNSAPIRDIAANAEFQRGRTDNHDDPMVVAEPRQASAGMSGKAFEAELAAMYPTPETPAQRIEREAQSRNKLWSSLR
jgi:hypothetical protein